MFHNLSFPHLGKNKHQVSQETFLLSPDAPAVRQHLEHLKAEREKENKKIAEQLESGGVEKSQAWISLHMSIAEKRFLILF